MSGELRNPPMKRQCKTCIFRPGDSMITPRRLVEIQTYLIGGNAHLCHTDGARACRGGRHYQLVIWHRLHMIAEPTDAALAEAMKTAGVE